MGIARPPTVRSDADGISWACAHDKHGVWSVAKVLRSAEERRAAFKSAAAPGNAAARQRTAASMVREQRRAAQRAGAMVVAL